MVTLVQLRVLEAIGRCGSVTVAAKDLHFTQPSLSHHVSRLESETGAQLLQRVGRGIRLTEAGELLAGRASEIIGRVDAATAELTADTRISGRQPTRLVHGARRFTATPARPALFRRGR